MKKILFVSRPIAPPWDEASKNFAFNLAKTVAKNNSDLELHLMTKGTLEELPYNVIQHPIYTSSKKDFRFSQQLRSLIFQIKNRNRFDVIHYFFTPTKLTSFLIKNLLRGKSKTIQTVATLREDLFSEKEIQATMFGDMIATYSEYATAKLKELGFNEAQRIYPGIDLSDYKLKEKDSELMQKCGFSVEDFIINFTGEYVRLGAIDDVIDSFIALSKKKSNVKLSLAVRIKNEQDAKKKKEVVAKLKKEEVLKKVAFHDNGDYRMSDIYNLCDISIFPVHDMKGKFDIPLAVVETMACEKPVIISDIPILKEFVKDQENGIIIPVGDINSLTKNILSFVENKDKMNAIGRAAGTFVRDRFDIKKSAEEYTAIYLSL